jgi:hypothetical protein
MADDLKNLLPKLSALELLRVAPMDEASRLAGASEDTLRRHHSDKIVKVSPRRDGMRVVDALMLNQSDK